MAVYSSFVDSQASLAQLLHSLTAHRTSYISCKRSHVDGRPAMTILQLFIPHKKRVYLLDVQTLGKTAFTTDIHVKTGATTLQSVLESPTFRKVFFDVRGVSHLLYNQFGIALQNIQDVQLMEAASHPSDARATRYVTGLRACIQRTELIYPSERQKWEAVYQAAARLFDPGLGGSLQVFQDRPLADEIRAYCMQESQYLPVLKTRYWHRHSRHGMAESVATETTARLQASQSAEFRSDDPARVISPFQRSSEVLSTFRPDFDKTKVRAPPHTTVNGLDSKDSPKKNSTPKPRPKPRRLVRPYLLRLPAFRKFWILR